MGYSEYVDEIYCYVLFISMLFLYKLTGMCLIYRYDDDTILLVDSYITNIYNFILLFLIFFIILLVIFLNVHITIYELSLVTNPSNMTWLSFINNYI